MKYCYMSALKINKIHTEITWQIKKKSNLLLVVCILSETVPALVPELEEDPLFSLCLAH